MPRRIDPEPPRCGCCHVRLSKVPAGHEWACIDAARARAAEAAAAADRGGDREAARDTAEADHAA